MLATGIKIKQQKLSARKKCLFYWMDSGLSLLLPVILRILFFHFEIRIRFFFFVFSAFLILKWIKLQFQTQWLETWPEIFIRMIHSPKTLATVFSTAFKIASKLNSILTWKKLLSGSKRFNFLWIKILIWIEQHGLCFKSFLSKFTKNVKTDFKK